VLLLHIELVVVGSEQTFHVGDYIQHGMHVSYSSTGEPIANTSWWVWLLVDVKSNGDFEATACRIKETGKCVTTFRWTKRRKHLSKYIKVY